MAVVVDDALLPRVLGGQPTCPGPGDGRLHDRHLVLQAGPGSPSRPPAGALSRRLAELPLDRQTRVLGLVDDLPKAVGLLSLRVPVPVMRCLDPDGRLNLLASEALAAAYVVGAAVLVATAAPLLGDACRAVGIEYQLVTA